MQKIAIITGASRGLGKSMALHLARKGTDILFTYKTQASQAQDVVREINTLGRKAAALQLDVTNSGSFEAFASAVKSALLETFASERFDFLINNAGVGVHAPFAETSEEQFDGMVNGHIKGPFFITQRLLPLLNDGGRILMVSTGLTRIIYPGYATYATMKGGIETLTRYLAKELGPRKIAVNVIAPGAIETDFGGGAVRDNKELNAMIAANTALGRVGLPDDIGSAVAAMLSDDAAWMTGQRVEFSGGQSI